MCSANPDPTSFRRIFVNRSVDDILYSAHHDIDTVLAAVDRQLRLVDASLNVTDLLERGVDVNWRHEVDRAFSADDDHFMPVRHDNQGHEVNDNDLLEWSSVIRSAFPSESYMLRLALRCHFGFNIELVN